MDKTSGQKRAAPHLYPAIEPFATHMLDVGDGHRLYVEECGRKDGIPVVVLHGGPGGGCSPAMRRYFDPKIFHIILFDQRGCGRSRPHASVEANTTWHLIEDIEHIRTLLKIDRWVVFGGSWGATLSLLYGQAHPERTAALILRGVFLMTRPELDWFYQGGAGQFWPDVWQRFTRIIPEDERGDMIAAYNRRLFSGDHAEETRFGRAWASWENALASIATDGVSGDSPAEYARAFARLENHYFTNLGFLDHPDHIVANVDRIEGIPGHVVQGRYDMICPPLSAWRLCQSWKSGQLHMIPRAGHALSEAGISARLVQIMDEIGKYPAKSGF